MNTNVNGNPRLHQAQNAYNQSRGWLLCIFIVSVINIFSMLFTEVYFVFSSYLSNVFISIGIQLTEESGSNVFYIVSAVIALILVVPYLLAFIFSKKRNGWMIAGFIFFAIDTVLICIDAFTVGFEYYIYDLVFHVIGVVMLGIGIVRGKELVLLRAQQAAAAAEAENGAAEGEATDGDASEPSNETEKTESAFAGCTRNITLVRKKSFVAAAAAFTVFVDGIAVELLKNGETKTVAVNGAEHRMIITTGNGISPDVIIPEGVESLTYNVSVKMGFSDLTINVDKA